MGRVFRGSSCHMGRDDLGPIEDALSREYLSREYGTLKWRRSLFTSGFSSHTY